VLTPPPEIRCLIFDWDGTLADTQYANYRAMAAALQPYDIALDQDWFDARTGLSSAEMIEDLLLSTPVSRAVPVGDVVAFRDEAFLRQCHTVREVPAVAEVARAHHGRLPVAVASGGARHIIEATLPHTGLTDVVDLLLTREDVHHGKPSPDLFLLAAERLEIAPSHCLVYEDSPQGLTAARSAGMAAIDVRPYRT
jgi:beta-phosphoglucomutase-like phosphatase (HAD superfamily)